MKILIAEDEFIGQRLLKEMLKPVGTCHVAGNGREAVEAVQSCIGTEYFDLICLDIMMPEMDGQQALKKIRAIENEKNVEKRAKIVMTTALDESNHITEAFLEGGCDGYLLKPIQKGLLMDKIRKFGLID